jgi:ribosomal protein S18 acetylase RimI-like enzyme
MNTIPNGYELAFLGISPTHQGKGLGKRLLQETISNLHRISMKFTCWLLVDITNVSAIKLYQKWGFRKWKEITPETGVAGWIMGLSYRRYRGPTVESCA